MTIQFSGEVIEWRGPAPFIFAKMPTDVAEIIKEVASKLSYGWGCIPAQVQIGSTTFCTALIPKDGGYLVPIKVAVQRAEVVELGQSLELELELAID